MFMSHEALRRHMAADAPIDKRQKFHTKTVYLID